MKIITGQYNTAKVFTDTLEETAEQQIETLCNQEFTSGAKIRLMPDVHTGAGCTIGTTMTITDKIVPNLVGVDIGCGMETVVIKAGTEPSDNFNPAKLDQIIRQKIVIHRQIIECYQLLEKAGIQAKLFEHDRPATIDFFHNLSQLYGIIEKQVQEAYEAETANNEDDEG